MMQVEFLVGCYQVQLGEDMHPCLSESSKAQRGGYYNPPSANPALLTGPKADMATLECPASPLTSQAVDEKNPRLMIKKHGP